MLTETRFIWLLTLLSVFAAAALARPPVTAPSYNELLEKSDLVCVLEVARVVESSKPHPSNPSPENVKSYVATCKVMGVFKGDAPKDEIRIPFYGHIFDPPVHFAAPLVETTQKQHEWVHYLAFLKIGKDGVFVPANGNFDVGFSFRVLFSDVDFDARQVLHKRQAQHNKAGPANQSQPSRPATNQPPAAAGSGR